MREENATDYQIKIGSLPRYLPHKTYVSYWSEIWDCFVLLKKALFGFTKNKSNRIWAFDYIFYIY